MRRTKLPALWIAFVALIPLLAALNLSAQIVGIPNEGCNVSETVTVSVSTMSGAAIQNAFVLFRADRLGTSNSAKPFQLELRTNAAGRATGSVPCGYVDFFVAADGFTPHAAKLLIEQGSSSASVRLEVYPIIQR
jgi:hypothetical protein